MNMRPIPFFFYLAIQEGTPTQEPQGTAGVNSAPPRPTVILYVPVPGFTIQPLSYTYQQREKSYTSHLTARKRKSFSTFIFPYCLEEYSYGLLFFPEKERIEDEKDNIYFNPP